MTKHENIVNDLQYIPNMNNGSNAIPTLKSNNQQPVIPNGMKPHPTASQQKSLQPGLGMAKGSNAQKFYQTNNYKAFLEQGMPVPQ